VGGNLFALTRILVPTNLGEPSQSAIKYGVAFARQFGAQLYLVHVLPQKDLDAALETERVLEVLGADAAHEPRPSAQAAAPAGMPRIAPEPDDVARNAAREELARLLDATDERDSRAEYLLRGYGAGGAGEAIVACAAELGVELIVMGKYRLGFLEHLIAGSVTEKVLRHAPCPVLIVQHPEHEFVLPSS
jgi:nucleotide-binding universal stress UspA family protein